MHSHILEEVRRSQARYRSIEAERRRMLDVLEDMEHENWCDLMHALDILADVAAHKPDDVDLARETLYRWLYNDGEQR